MSTKRTREDSPLSHTSKRSRPECLTFKNRDGETQSTYSWPSSDDLVALRTPPRGDPATHESIFLVNRVILCRDSLVFKDILSLPTPENPKPEDVYEGRPLINVQDNPQDLQDFLEAIHDWRAYFESGNLKSIPRVSALLRLGTKYQVGFLRRLMIKELKDVLPQTREEVDEKPDLDTADLCTILATLEEINYPLLLPITTYLLAAESGWKDIITDTTQGWPSADRADGIWFASEESRARVLTMHRIAGVVYSSMLNGVLGVRHKDCEDPTSCEKVLLIWHRWWNASRDPDVNTPYTLLLNVAPHYLHRSCYEYDEESLDQQHPGLCGTCDEFSMKKFEPLLEEAWDRLPVLLGLGNWDELKSRLKAVVEDVDGEDEGNADEAVSETE